MDYPVSLISLSAFCLKQSAVEDHFSSLPWLASQSSLSQMFGSEDRHQHPRKLLCLPLRCPRVIYASPSWTLCTCYHFPQPAGPRAWAASLGENWFWYASTETNLSRTLFTRIHFVTYHHLSYDSRSCFNVSCVCECELNCKSEGMESK